MEISGKFVTIDRVIFLHASLTPSLVANGEMGQQYLSDLAAMGLLLITRRENGRGKGIGTV